MNGNKEMNPVPQQEKGVQTNTESTTRLNSEEEAKKFYQIVKKRLLHVDGWKALAGPATANFCLVDEKGNEVERRPEKGDYFSIDIPAPKSETGEGYDWVRIESVEEYNDTHDDSIVITVRPAPNPRNRDKDIAHFFDDDATSSFMVQRHESSVTASVHGRNEMPNTETESIKDRLRNAVVAGGAISGFSKIQWKALVNGLVHKND